ncbi:MAG: hypothetical protein M1840_001459 [Geoglossum simile]|nr:MAG: hypothetical protein M1840_001459 [Geoglossum simile]
MAAALAGYPTEGLSSMFHLGKTEDSTLGEQRAKSVILNRKSISVMGISIYLTGLLVAAITYILQPVVDPSAVVSHAGISTACGFNLSMEDLIRAGPGCGSTPIRSQPRRLTELRTAECLLGTASETTGPFAAGEGTSLVKSGLMRLRGSGLTASYGICRSTYGNSPGNRSVRFGYAAAAYPDRAWLESLVTLPGDCQVNAMGKACGWELTGLGAPRLEAGGNVPVYVARVQCVRSTHFAQLYLPKRPASMAEPSEQTSSSLDTFPLATPTLVAQALPSGGVAFKGPLAGVYPVFGSEPPFNEVVPELKEGNARVTFAVLPAGIIPNSRFSALEDGGWLDLSADDFRLNVSFVCGASIYATEQHIALGLHSVSIQLPDIEFSEDEYPVSLDLSNTTPVRNVAAGNRVLGLNRSNVDWLGLETVERGGILAALDSVLGRIWDVPGAKAIAGPFYVKYREERGMSGQGLWLSGSVLGESFATPHAGAEEEVAQVLADTIRLLCLGLSKPAWLKSVRTMDYEDSIQNALRDLETSRLKTVYAAARFHKHLQTLKNNLELKKVIAILGDSNATPTRVGRKLRKAAEVLHTQVTILEAKQLSLFAHIKEIEEVVSRKRKRVPGIGPKTIGEVVEAMVEKQSKWVTRRCRCLTTPLSNTESDWNSLAGTVDDDISSYIIVTGSE